FVIDHEAFCVPNRRLSRHRRGNSQRFDVAAQNANAKRMKRRDHWLDHGEPTNDFLDPLAHLRCSFIREGHSENGLRHYAEMLDQMRDSICNDAGFAATSSGQNERRPLGGFDRLTLLRIELGEKRQRRNGSGDAYWNFTGLMLQSSLPGISRACLSVSN